MDRADIRDERGRVSCHEIRERLVECELLQPLAGLQVMSLKASGRIEGISKQFLSQTKICHAFLFPFIPPHSRDLRLQHEEVHARRRPPPSSFPPRRPQSNPITTATMKLALSTLLVGSAAAFAPAPAARSATQLHESKVR